MKLFFDYFYYRVTKAYLKYDGEIGVTAMVLIGFIELMLLLETIEVFCRIIYGHTKIHDISSLILGLIIFGLAIPIMVFNYVKYRKKYRELDEIWKDEKKI